MKRRTALSLTIGLVAVALLVWGATRRAAGSAESYRFAAVERGEVISVVSSTGTLRAITTVQVGTQVSGQIDATMVDFNDRVKKGQLIARIDPTLLEQEVRAAEAALERNRAEMELATQEAERSKRLFEDDLTSESVYLVAQSNREVAAAVTKNAQINLERARRNLGYSEIRAPIDGVVIERNVDVGQTVAASFSAPQLFLIAEDLSKLQILASVDESDIGRIHEGQAARFSVQSYPDEKFTGRVEQVRLQSAVTENVVSYSVVVAVENPEGRLLPGMTTTVDFVLESAADVLKVSNVALRFRPTEEMRKKLGDGVTRTARRGAERGGADSTAARGAAPGDSAPSDSASGASRNSGASDRTVLWTIGKDGKPSPIRVKTGITDGQFTVVEGPELREGLEVIAAVASGEASANASNPFQPQQQRGGTGRSGPPPGM